MSKTQKPPITVGIPVYNGEKTLRKTLDSVKSQTFENFAVIISDNASADSTADICKEYVDSDNRIEYIRQEKNTGLFENFYYLLHAAQTEFFVWLAADDYWDKTFLEKTFSALASDDGLVGSMGRVKYYDAPPAKFNRNRKIKRYFSYDEYPKQDGVVERVSFYLRLGRSENMYGLYRTDKLKQCEVKKQHAGCDLAVILKALTFGRIKLLDDTLLYRSRLGLSSRKENKFATWNDYGIVGVTLPYLPLMWWIWRNLGTKIFFKNLDYLLSRNLSFVIWRISDIMRRN